MYDRKLMRRPRTGDTIELNVGPVTIVRLCDPNGVNLVVRNDVHGEWQVCRAVEGWWTVWQRKPLRTIVLPWSEVCMHMHIAGATMEAYLTDSGMVQLVKDDREFSIPITRGEAGWDMQHELVQS